MQENTCPLIIVANIGPTMAVFKFYDTTEEDDSPQVASDTFSLRGHWWTNTYYVAASKTFCYNNTVYNVEIVMLTQPQTAIKTILILFNI